MLPTAWREAWIAWRNRRLSDPAFQRWAADFPLTGGVARKSTRDLFDVVAGFVYSQTLAAGVELGLFERLRAGPLSTAELARSLDLPADSTDRLLGAAAALGLVERLGGDRYALGRHGAALLGAPGLVEMIRHHRHFYADLAEPAALLRGSAEPRALAAYWPYATTNAPKATDCAAVGPYSALMAASQPSVTADILDAYSLRRHRRVMDVGGGEGVFLAAAAARWPSLQLTLFDLPAVVFRAREALGRAGVLDRAELVGGDFHADPMPTGADLITFIRILHDQDDAGVARLLASARAVLPAQGALLIAEPMAGASRPEPVGDAYFAFYLHAMGRGRARTPAELIEASRTAGFRQARLLRTRSPFLLRVIVARP